MSPRLRRLVVPAAAIFVVVLVLNLVLGNGFLPGVVIGLVAAAVMVAVEAVIARRQGRSGPDAG